MCVCLNHNRKSRNFDLHTLVELVSFSNVSAIQLKCLATFNNDKPYFSVRILVHKSLFYNSKLFFLFLIKKCFYLAKLELKG